MNYYTDRSSPEIDKIVKATFPDYTGKKVMLSTLVPKVLDSFWTDGSRNFYTFYHLTTGQTYNVESNHTFFEPDKPHNLKQLPQGVIIVCHVIFQGKDMGIKIYANESDLTPMIPPSVETSMTEKIVLQMTQQYKPSYAGIKEYRFQEAHRQFNMPRDLWDSARVSCITKGLLDKRGAITNAGRNALSSDLH